MGSFDIVGLGLSTLDLLLRVRAMPTWDDPGSVSSFGIDGGGPVGTACVAAAKLGARVAFVGLAGNDEAAQLKLKSFRDVGVDLSGVVLRDGPERRIMIVYVDEATGERTFCPLEGFGREELQPDELQASMFVGAKLLHLDGHYIRACRRAMAWVREGGGQVVIDCSRTSATSVGQNMAELVREVDILISGSGFCRALTGHADRHDSGSAILDMGPKRVIETDGDGGSYTTTVTEHFHTPAIPVDVIDTTGAGDVFHGAYLVGLLRNWDPHVIAEFATAVAALKCTHLGGRRGIPSYEEVMEFMAAHRPSP